MIFVTYCEDQPFAGQIAAARKGLSIEDLIDIEDALQRWALFGPEDAHVYAWVGRHSRVLARRVPYVKRTIVGVQELKTPEIIVVSIVSGRGTTIGQYAFLYLDPAAGSIEYNQRWTG